MVFGVLLSTLLSLFVVPAFYRLLARFTIAGSPKPHARDARRRVASVDRSHGG